MKAITFHGVGDIRLDDVPEPAIQDPTDAVIRITATAICGTDLHMVRGTLPGMKTGTILGHEAVGVIEAVGDDVRDFKVGDRVVVPSTIACGYCAYCRAGYYAQCDNANPGGHLAGTAFFGGPESSGAFSGLQAERARIPFANVGLVKIPDGVTDDQALLISDVFPTGYFGAELAEIKPGDTVAVFGLGPVGQFAIASAKHMGAGRVIGVDNVPSRLDMARDQGAETIDFSVDDPVTTIRHLTGDIGVDRAIDAVGVDALSATAGTAPGQALEWAINALAKAGSLAVIGVYPPTMDAFPVGVALAKNLTIKLGNCNHRKYIPKLLEMVRSGIIDPAKVLTHVEPMVDAIDAYKAFEARQPGWIKVEVTPPPGPRPAA